MNRRTSGAILPLMRFSSAVASAARAASFIRIQNDATTKTGWGWWRPEIRGSGGLCDTTRDSTEFFWNFAKIQRFVTCITFVFPCGTREQVPLSAPHFKRVSGSGVDPIYLARPDFGPCVFSGPLDRTASRASK